MNLYWEQGLSAFELNQQNSKTLRRWSHEAPEGVRFILPLEPGLLSAGFKGPQAEEAWDRSLKVAKRLPTDLLLLRTPAHFRPTKENREALKAFFGARLKGSGLRLAWWAEGLWEGLEEEWFTLCEELGVTPILDPLAMEDDPPLEGDFYWRLMGRRGMSAGFSDYDLERLLEWSTGRSGVVLFSHSTMLRDAKRFVQWSAEFAEGASQS